MNLRDLLVILHRSWGIILVATLLGAGLSAAWSLAREPQYLARAQLFVTVKTDEASSATMTRGAAFARAAVASYAPIANKSVVLKRVITDLNLDTTVEELSEQVSADALTNTSIITISVTDPRAEQAASIANKTSVVLADVISNHLERTSYLGTRVQLELIESAQVPEQIATPRTASNIGLGIFSGLGLGVGLAVVRGLLDTRVRSRGDVEAVTDVPILGVIGRDDVVGRGGLVSVLDPLSPLVESYRVLRTNLRYVGVGGVARSVVVTSSAVGEGKSTTAANLAVVLADAGGRVVLVDADLRKPSLAVKLGIEGEVGLSDVLIGRVSLEGGLQRWGKNQLFVLPAGRVPPNPSELLGSGAMEAVVGALGEVFDWVIVDAPPALAVTDAAVLSGLTGGALMVVASDRARRHEVAGALESLGKVGGRVLGVVMTMVLSRGVADAYGYGASSYGTHQGPEAPTTDLSGLKLEVPLKD